VSRTKAQSLRTRGAAIAAPPPSQMHLFPPGYHDAGAWPVELAGQLDVKVRPCRWQGAVVSDRHCLG